MNSPSRIIRGSFLLALVLGLNGCMTNAAIHRASGTSSRDFPSGSGKVVHYQMHLQSHPAYYALLPLTIPADIIASPFELGFYFGQKHHQEP